MRRTRRPTLRGSVTQKSGSVRIREAPRLNFFARAAIVGGTAFVVFLFGLWGWKTGWFHQQAREMADNGLHLTQKAHFAVGDIVVEGRKYTDKAELLAAIDAPPGSPILAFSPTAAAARIAKLPWVSAVSVERRLPGTLYVRITERTPQARWQHDNHVSVIDSDGEPLPQANAEQFTQLPLLVGTGAPSEAKDFLDTMRLFPDVEQHMTSAVRVSERRWDVHLRPNIVARLPETNVADALKRLNQLIDEQKILERDIVGIDLRFLPDRLIIESPNAPSSQHPANGDNSL